MHAEKNKIAGKWHESMQGILYVVGDHVQFVDDWDHWRNAFCRLLEISEEKAKAFVENAVAAAGENQGQLFNQLSCEDRVKCLKQSTDRTFYDGGRTATNGTPQTSWGADLQGAPADTVLATSISGNKSRIVVGNKKHEFGWLIDPQTSKPVRADSIVYDTSYFSTGRDAGHYGMKQYLQQSDWRMDKSKRLVRSVMSNCGERTKKWLAEPQATEVLDVGSAIGYFRKAFSEYGFKHYGTELSTDMIEQCHERFGFETWHGGITALEQVAAGKKFQIITLWDVIEHLADVVDLIKILRDFLSDDGILVVRTPNLMAFERDILGDFYYSFKLDHILYFSPHSLSAMMQTVDLEPLHLETDSHIFKGFLGADYLYQQGRQLKGADILAVYKRKGSA